MFAVKKNLQISYAGHVSDRVQDLYYGKVAPEGIDLHYIPLQPFEAFPRMLRGDFDCAEMSFSTYVIRVAQQDMPFIAIPVFPSRTFRHNAIYINRKAGIDRPQDLAGRTIGVPEYTSTAMVWARGMLRDEYGVDPRDIRWITGGLKDAGRKPKFKPQIPGVDIQHTEDRTLNDMLVSGELDAIIAPQMPPAFRAGHPDIGHLFPDYPEVERAYYRKTGIFPIMHVVVLRKELYEQHPWAAVSLYQAFDQARRNCMDILKIEEPLPISVPWIFEFAKSARDMMGDDYWPYGIEKNTKEIEALCRYTWEQGLVPRKVELDELFAPNVASLSQLRL
jgi:4,5-dihydroxyphthalate decarboxylase